jgi:hypothetical protein
VLVTGPDARPVPGTIEFDADARGFRFVAAAAVLEAGAYRVVLRSGVDGFHSFFGLLDGDGDGVRGGDYQRAFTVVPAQADRGLETAPTAGSGLDRGLETAPTAGSGLDRGLETSRSGSDRDLEIPPTVAVPGAHATVVVPETSPVDAPRIELGQAFAGFALTAGLAFGAAVASGHSQRTPGARPQGDWRKRLFAGDAAAEEAPNRSIAIRLDD